MALPASGSGYQTGDGNLDERQFNNVPAPVTAADTATLTAAQVLNGIILATPTAAANYTLPTVTLLEAALGNAVKTGNYFEFSVINLASSNYDITMVLGTGWTVTGGGVVVVQEASSARFGARKTGATTWQLYRLA